MSSYRSINSDIKTCGVIFKMNPKSVNEKLSFDCAKIGNRMG